MRSMIKRAFNNGAKVRIAIMIALSFIVALSLSSCQSSKYPKVSSEKFDSLEHDVDDAITVSRKDIDKGIVALEALPLLPKLLEDRRNYVLATLYEEKKDLPMAFISYNKVSKNYLSKYSLWNFVKLSQKIGFERIVVENLNTLISQFPKEPKFNYELAKSYARQSNFNEARKIFKSIQKAFPKSDYAIGASYYLGNMAGDDETKLTYFIDYLKKSPEGSLSSLVSDQIVKIYERQREPVGENLEEAKEIVANVQRTGKCSETIGSQALPVDCILNPNNLKEIENLIALSYFSSADYKKAVKYFDSANGNWFEHAKTLGKVGRVQDGIDLIMTRLPEETNEELAKDALEHLISISSSWRRVARLKELAPKMNIIKDKVYWHIAERTKSKADYRAVYDNFPDSYYAPESMSRVFWTEFKRKSYVKALELANKHWENYSHARSHPFVAFWRGKIYLEMNKLDEARAAFTDLIETHPRDYYRFRAEAILDQGNNNNWFSLPKSNQFETIVNWDWPMPYTANQIRRTHGKDLVELINIQQFGTLLALEESEEFSFDKKMRMWLYAMDENNLKAISTAYFDLKSSDPIDYEDIRHQYSFPMLYSDLVADEASKNLKVDPLLAHALIKQESRYQPEIVSRVGAIGLMQLMPYTAKSLARQKKLKSPSLQDLRNPELNIALGMAFLEDALQNFDNNLVYTVASYNAGPNAVKRWKTRFGTDDLDMFIEEIPYNETRDYTKKVLGNYWIYKKLYG